MGQPLHPILGVDVVLVFRAARVSLWSERRTHHRPVFVRAMNRSTGSACYCARARTSGTTGGLVTGRAAMRRLWLGFASCARCSPGLGRTPPLPILWILDGEGGRHRFNSRESSRAVRAGQSTQAQSSIGPRATSSSIHQIKVQNGGVGSGIWTVSGRGRSRRRCGIRRSAGHRPPCLPAFLNDERESSRSGPTAAPETRVVEAMRDNDQESCDAV
jgi:hypothetical protein